MIESGQASIYYILKNTFGQNEFRPEYWRFEKFFPTQKKCDQDEIKKIWLDRMSYLKILV